ncbi:MAG: hypothetical protein ACRDBO_16920 [Lachnospiraceae bacterium]
MKLWNDKKKLLVIGMIIASAAGSMIWYGWRNRPNTEYQFSADAVDGEYVMTDIDYRERLAEMETGYFRIQINARPEVSRGKCNLMVGNPSDNDVAVQVLLFIDDSGAEIFRSEILKPGERKAYVELSQQLEPGEYAATAVFQMLEPDSNEVAGEIEAGVIITVLS